MKEYESAWGCSPWLYMVIEGGWTQELGSISQPALTWPITTYDHVIMVHPTALLMFVTFRGLPGPGGHRDSPQTCVRGQQRGEGTAAVAPEAHHAPERQVLHVGIGVGGRGEDWPVDQRHGQEDQ